MTEETKLQESEVSEEKVSEGTATEEKAAEAVEEQAPEVVAAAEESEEAISQTDMENMMTVKNGDILKGKIVKVEDNQVFVDVGYKYDGIITIRELSSLHLENASEAAKVDDEVECKVLSIDDEKEKLLLSKRAIASEKAWDVLQAQFESQETIEAVVADVVKGGLVVDVGVRGFIPASMVERHFVEDFSDYKGRTLRLKVKELDIENKKVILSQRDVLDAEFASHKKDILSKIKVDQQLEGTVQRLTPFGAFVDLGGIDGLVHISEMAWEHVDQPSDIVKEGDSVKVKVLKVDPENERISLSMKATQAGPWETIDERFKIGDTITGVVKRLVNFGAFVEIAPGVEGLVHISQISHNHIATPHEVLKEGQEVNVKILDLNLDDKRVSLSIKETEEAPASPTRSDGRGGSASAKDIADNENVSVNNQGLSLTLGERFGDKLNKFK
jgi:small subunit ribosomal protein S1